MPSRLSPPASVLRVEGEVAHALTLASADLATLAGQIADVSELVPGRSGQAIRVAEVLERAGPLPTARFAELASGDGRFTATVPLDALAHAVLVHRLGESALPAELGGPVRLLIPDVAGCGHPGVDSCSNVKFLAVIRLTRDPGRDDRPRTAAAHDELHLTPGHEHLPGPRR